MSPDPLPADAGGTEVGFGEFDSGRCLQHTPFASGIHVNSGLPSRCTLTRSLDHPLRTPGPRAEVESSPTLRRWTPATPSGNHLTSEPPAVAGRGLGRGPRSGDGVQLALTLYSASNCGSVPAAVRKEFCVLLATAWASERERAGAGSVSCCSVATTASCHQRLLRLSVSDASRCPRDDQSSSSSRAEPGAAGKHSTQSGL